MSSYGIRATIPGFDVRTSTDPTKLVLSSEYDSLKVATKGTISITTDGSGVGLGTVPHTLGYIPSYIVYGQRDPELNNWFPDQHFRGEFGGFTDHLPTNSAVWFNKISDTELTIRFESDTVGTTTNFVYYILHDEVGT